LAVDVHSASEPKRLNWLIANVKEFGFSWEVVPSEPWHLRYVSGDNAPASVKAWMEANGVTAPAAGAPVTAAGARGEHTALQEALKAKGFYKGNVDGAMSPALQEAVKAFKVANKLGADFVVGPKVKQLLGLE
jgi:peptidoglycan hydrolase-like protein with peptidoglycan-binding domain